MSRIWVTACFVALVALCWTCSLSGQEDFKIKLDVALVTTDVTVIGTPASELRPEDFLVYDNDVAQPISYFSRDQIPLAVAIVIDRSLTVQSYMPLLRIAAISSLGRLKPADQIALFAFDFRVQKLNDLTDNRSVIAEKIGKIQNKLGTNIYDAIYDSAEYLKKKAPQRRRAIILITDNIRYGDSGHGAKNTREELLETATTLYNIKTPPDAGAMFSEENRRSLQETDAELRRMALESGGEVLDMRAGFSIQAALERVISHLRLQYTIGFNPSDTGADRSFRRLAVKLAAKERCPACQLLTRAGYYPGVSVAVRPPSGEQPKASLSKKEPKPEKSLIEQTIAFAGDSTLRFTDISFSAKASDQTNPNGMPEVRVDLNIDARRITFRDLDGTHAFKLRITVFYANSNGKILGSVWQSLEGALKEESYSQTLRSGLPFTTSVPLKVEKQIHKIIVYDELSEKMGSRVILP